MRFKNKKPIHLMAGLLIIGLSACGGGGGGSSSNKGTTVSGTAMAPGGTVAMFEEQSFLMIAADFLISSANAEISGLQPVMNAEIELIRLSNDGLVEEVLASTQLGTDGSYSLKLPAGITFAANLVLRITSSDGSRTLDAQVLESNTDINPYSDYLLDKLLENRTRLDSLAINEALVLKGKLEEYDLTATSDMSSMLEALEAVTGEFMDQSIASINNGDGDATLVEGNYHLGEFTLSLHDSDAELSGTFSTELRLQEASFSANGTSLLNVVLENARIDTWYNLSYTEAGPHFLYLENELGNDFETLEAETDDSGAIIVESAFEEDIEDCAENQNPAEDCFAWRFPSTTSRLESVGSNGVFLGRFISAGVRYHQTAEGVLDPERKDGDEVFYNMAILAKQGTESGIGTLNGRYGTIGLGAAAEHETGVTYLDSFHFIGNFNGDGTYTGEDYFSQMITRSHDGAPVVSPPEVIVENGTYNVTPTGKFNITFGDTTDSGFISPDGSLLAVYFKDVVEQGTNPITITEASNGMAVGVELPAAQPTMAGKSYLLHGVMFGYGTMNSTLSTLSNSTLSFDTGPSISIEIGRSRGIERDTDTSDLQAFANEENNISGSYQAPSTGQFTASLAVDSASTLTIDGFISGANENEMVIFRTTYVENDIREVGLFIGTRTN